MGLLVSGRRVVPGLGKELTTQFPGLEVVGYAEFGNTHGTDETKTIAGLPDSLASRDVDAVVSGIGC